MSHAGKNRRSRFGAYAGVSPGVCRTAPPGIARRAGLSLLAAALVATCTVGTQYVLHIDVLSFLSEEERSQALSYDDTEAVDLYVFPALTHVPAGTFPGAEFEIGYPVEFPGFDEEALDDLPADIELTLTFRVDALFENGGGAELGPADAYVYVSELGSDNVFDEGVEVGGGSIPAIGAGESGTLSLENSVSLAQYEAVVASGGLQIGVRISLDAQGDNTVTADVTLTAAEIEVSGFPLRALP